MKRQVQVLNGDALDCQLPDDIGGLRIICRECLVDGPVQSTTLNELLKIRAQFISTAYPDITEQEYHDKLEPELNKILSLGLEDEINLWFEDDLFCQVNLWWVIHLLAPLKLNRIFLVRPKVHTRYGFGGLSPIELKQIYDERIPLDQLEIWQEFWKAYQNGDVAQLVSLAGKLQKDFPFVMDAVKAYEAAIPQENWMGRPRETLSRLLNELGSEDFGKVFQAFCDEESIYGYGDLQVRRMFDEIVDEMDVDLNQN